MKMYRNGLRRILFFSTEYRMSISSCPRARQLLMGAFCTKRSLHLLEI